MNLEQALKQLPAAQKVKIGAKRGSAWFYCGTVRQTFEHFDWLAKRVSGYDKIGVVNAKKNLAKALEECDPAAYVMDAYNPTAQGYMEHLTVVFEKAHRAREALKKHEYEFKQLKPLFGRKVIEQFQAVTDPDDPVCLLIEGNEHGTAWLWADAKGLCLAKEVQDVGEA